MTKISPYIVLLAIVSCTEIDLENEEETNILGLTASSIDTELDVVNIAVDQAAFDHMYENFRQNIFVDVMISWYSDSGDTVLWNEPARMELKGSFSVTFPLKSLGLIFPQELNNEEGNLLRPPKVLSGHSLDTFKKIRFRNSGNDFQHTMLKDLALTQLAIDADLDIDLTYGHPVEVFINDRYYGLLNIRTESDSKGISSLREVPEDQITVLEADSRKGDLEFETGDSMRATVLQTAIRAGDRDQLWTLLDIPNFIDYLIFQDYVGNEDWPNNNCMIYSVGNEPFRFFMFDLDRAIYHTKNPRIPELEYLESDVALMFQALMSHPEFMARLKERQKEVYKKLSAEHFEEIVDRFSARIASDMTYQIAKYRSPQSLLHWRLNLEHMKRDFVSQDKHIRKKYGL